MAQDKHYNEIEIQNRVVRALGSVSPIKDKQIVPCRLNKLLSTDELPPYYKLFFLFSGLLKYPTFGPSEKLSFAICFEYEGNYFSIEHRKFGLGVFGEKNELAPRIRKCLFAATKAAEPYFKMRAQEAASGNSLNVHNRCYDLRKRYEFFRDRSLHLKREADDQKGKISKKELSNESGNKSFTFSFPALQLIKQSQWNAESAIDAFFSWTEHLFIHLAAIKGNCRTGKDIEKMAQEGWADKFKASLGCNTPTVKKHFDHLTEIRRRHRNFVAHGSFGKDGEAFSFHSEVGAVPLILREKSKSTNYIFEAGQDLDVHKAIQTIDQFIYELDGGLAGPAYIYVQEYALDTILSFVEDGTFEQALQSATRMTELADKISDEVDRASNMDF